MKFTILHLTEMAQASLRLGRALTGQTVRRNFCVSSAISGKHVNYSVQDGVAVLRYFYLTCMKYDDLHAELFRFDSPDSKVNSLGVESSEDLKACFEKFMADSSAKSAVLVSGKPGCFIAGADINMLASCKTAEEATALSKGCQDLLFEVEKSSKPVVAAIQGKLLLVLYNSQ